MTSRPEMHALALSSDDSVILVHIRRADLVDPGFIAQAQMRILDAVAEIDQPRVLLDLSHVRLASSAAVGLTLAVNRAVEEQHGALALVVPCPTVRAVFERCRVDSIIPMHRQEESARQALGLAD